MQERHGNESNAGIDYEIAFVDMIALRKEAASKLMNSKAFKRD